jgi:hypothetical protein
MNPAPVASADGQIPVRKCAYLISLVVISSPLRLYVILFVLIHPSSEMAAIRWTTLTRCEPSGILFSLGIRCVSFCAVPVEIGRCIAGSNLQVF